MKQLPNKIKITIEPFCFNSEKTSPLALFTPLSDLPWSIWLDSCQSDHVDSRFDILVWQPEVTLSTYGQTTVIQDHDSTSCTSTEDPLSLVEKYQQQVFHQFTLPNKSICADLPFIGGALGYFAYDLGKRFEKLPTIAKHDISLADMAIGIYCQAIIYDKQDNSCYLVCPENKRAQLTEFLLEKLHNHQIGNDFKLQSQWHSNISQSDYGKKFKQVQDYLLNGDCYQINLAQRFSTQYTGDEFHAYQALRASNNAPFSAFMRFEDSAVLSISPERFLSVKNSKVQSKPIKGTCARNSDSEIDQHNAIALQQSIKDRAENVMIVDLLRNDISKVCKAGSVVVPELFVIESFPAVHHLVSTVEGQLKQENNNTDLLRAAFPGGSITGAPKIRAMQIIEELEPHSRSVYCGSIGYISACGSMDTSVTIRTLVCQQNNIHCWAGGGLVADSTLDSEYQETFDKVQKILPVLSAL